MRIGVLGGRGNLGKRLVQTGIESVECDLLDVNLTNQLDGFDVLINCAGKYDFQWVRENWVPAYKINVFGLENVLKSYKGKIIHISCDLFYDGRMGFYSEEDKRSYFPFSSALSTNKYFQEIILDKFANDHLIIRTSELYDVGTKNITELFKRIYALRPISGATNILFTPTYIPHLVQAILYLIEKNESGLINVAGTDYCTEEHFNKVFCEMGKYNNFHKAGISHRSLDERQPRRLGLDVQKAFDLGVPLFSLEQGMKALWKWVP